MVNIFENYEYIPKDYVPRNTSPVLISQKPHLPYVEYDTFDNPIGFTWNYGDSIVLKLNISGTVTTDDGIPETAEVYLPGKTVIIVIRNFRGEVVSTIDMPASTDLSIIIDDNLYSNMIPGVYKLALKLVDSENNLESTLVSPDECVIYVK